MTKTATKIVPQPKKGPRNDWTLAIGDRIQRLRLSIGLTQEEFSMTIGLKGRNAIAMIESGRNFPTLATLTALRNKYHVSYDYLLLGEKPEIDKGNEQEIKRLTEEGVRLRDENKKLREYIDLLTAISRSATPPLAAPKTRSKK